MYNFWFHHYSFMSNPTFGLLMLSVSHTLPPSGLESAHNDATFIVQGAPSPFRIGNSWLWDKYCTDTPAAEILTRTARDSSAVFDWGILYTYVSLLSDLKTVCTYMNSMWNVMHIINKYIFWIHRISSPMDSHFNQNLSFGNFILCIH